MNWKEHIVSDPEILAGKPTIKGTRLSVELILDRLADGWTEQDLYRSYPNLTPVALHAVFAFASAPTSSRVVEIIFAVGYRLVPLKTMCSKKCASPLIGFSS